MTELGMTTEGCDAVCMIVSLSQIDGSNGNDFPFHHKVRRKKTPLPLGESLLSDWTGVPTVGF
jgi:hypothetical protein